MRVCEVAGKKVSDYFRVSGGQERYLTQNTIEAEIAPAVSASIVTFEPASDTGQVPVNG